MNINVDLKSTNPSIDSNKNSSTDIKDQVTQQDQQLELKQQGIQDNSANKEKDKTQPPNRDIPVQGSTTEVRFKFHEQLKEYYAQIIDKKTGQVLDEIPSKKLLDQYAFIAQKLGFIVDKKI